MKTAGRKNPNRWANASSNRPHGAAVQHRSCSVKWAAKQENVQPLEMCFILTSPFIELNQDLHQAVTSAINQSFPSSDAISRRSCAILARTQTLGSRFCASSIKGASI